MAVCEEIRQSVDVNAPAARANAQWTQFVFWNIYHRPLGVPDVSEADPEAGFVHLEAIDDQTTRVTIDLNYCARLRDLSDAEEIAKVQQHLQGTLTSYKTFIESAKARP